MGYVENVCQFCGVSFCIARLRRPDEPEDHAWAYHGGDFVEEEEGLEWEPCSPSKTGCELREREGFTDPEHIAGPGCLSTKGYSSYRISCEEMKGCRTVQCLVEKTPEWQAEEDDQEFELESNFFLTGKGDGSPDEGPLQIIPPVRHGISELMICNCEIASIGIEGLPFHPTCFKIFQKISKARFGKVDLAGLWYWFNVECTYEYFFEQFPRDYAVRAGTRQWWFHTPGCEYLAANPIEVPGLPDAAEITDSMKYFGTSRYDIGKETIFDADNIGEQPSPDPSKSNSGAFVALPVELRNIILGYLSSKEIANLRLAMPVFRVLPMLLFKRLLQDDMPWFFEEADVMVPETDWHRLYCTVKFCWQNLMGLKNRRRIWKDVNKIVDKIAAYRSEGGLEYVWYQSSH